MPSIEEFCEIVKNFNITINNIFELGSLDGYDAHFMKCKMNAKKVFIFEADKNFAEAIKKKYPEYDVMNFAVTNVNSDVVFNSVCYGPNKGIGSLREQSSYMLNLNTENNQENVEKFNKVAVKGIRMEDWIIENNIESIDMCKIDVEGCSYECLEGFGDKIKIIKFLHIENEHIPCWENQKLYEDVKNYLEKNNFKLLKIKIGGPPWAKEQQSDSVWVNKNIFY